MKEDKVGADGLTKKEHRSLKVQAKQPQENNVPVSKNKTENLENKQIIKPAIEQKNNVAKPPKSESVTRNNKSDTPSKQLTDKEIRKLEWEKKLAEQNIKTEVNDNSVVNLNKSELKAKRREQQEAQRLAKAAAKSDPIQKHPIKEEKS
ncbi:hypothetical protein NQ314_010407 [Rhamnusium bicolor]|uniref:Uncharacterized protein n=1 Tax=Rhamnusium bicolor TaxID=1586634 RepID=A0AAV8XR29_9CUCU|nr:hypothetical protein NQ314_010407 [Rhamnusium bicolor]